MENHSRDLFTRIDGSSRAAYLIAGSITKTLSITEEEELDNWILESRENMKVFEDLTDDKIVSKYLEWYNSRNVEKRLKDTRAQLGIPVKGRVVVGWKFAAAASILLLITSGVIYFWTNKDEDEITVEQPANDILPGGEYAQLKLADGQIISLKHDQDTIINNMIAVKNGEVINKDAEISSINELIIPKKAWFKVVLPDGTKVFLNSMSSIQYPSSFRGDNREVVVTGETYFEVAKDPVHPFIVSVKGIKVQALGTQFNINAYDNEEGIKTTLIEGSVKLFDNAKSEILKPSEQLIITGRDWKVRKQIDTAPVTAWTRNEFKLKKAPTEEVMRMVERWYGAKIIYQDKVEYHFNGTISRNLPVSHLLELLEETGNIHFIIKDNQITVLK